MTTKDGTAILAEDVAQIDIGGETYTSNTRLTFNPNRFPSIEFHLSGLEVDIDDTTVIRLRLESSGFEIVGKLEQLLANTTNATHRFRETDPMSLEKPGGGEVVLIEGLLYNLGPFGLQDKPSSSRNQVQLDLPDGWQANIGPLTPALKKCRKVLGNSARYPTNTFMLVRTQPGVTSPSEIDETLFLLRYLLSFAWGRTIGMGQTQGFSQAGELIFARPGITHMDGLDLPMAHPPNWFPPWRAEILNEIVPGFWRRMKDPSSKDGFDWAVYYWLSANHQAQVSETSILASQAGLESVAPTLLHGAGKFTNKVIEEMTAPELVRQMLNVIGAPLDVPSQLSELAVFASSHGCDGPQAFAKVRNALSHRRKGKATELAFEASQLGMWYLELVVLYLVDYRGNIRNRTKFQGPWFEVETVPWC